ncbi:hypothetical protein NHQ30_008130 [Ciborinia camelliae]|nr:hypothetical protein NHQ30_008130 [Ciborinia camelliae]
MPDTEMDDAFSAPSFEPRDLSQLHYHITLLRNVVAKYTRVYALLLLWEDEDPQLPVSLEVHELGVVLASIYNFEVEIYRIPSNGSHKKLNQKVLDFVELGDDSKDDLKNSLLWRAWLIVS